MRSIFKSEWGWVAVGALISMAAGVLTYTRAAPVLTFIVSGAALAILAKIVGDGAEHLGSRLSPGLTGILQSAIGNLPELFVGIFALRAGLVTLVQSALIGSILANSLLVLGMAFLFGGLKNGPQRFGSDTPRVIAMLTVLSVAALTVPTLAQRLHTPAEAHEDVLSLACAIVLLLVFLASIPHALGGSGHLAVQPAGEGTENAWPLRRTIPILLAAGMGAAVVSEWFVRALEPATATLHLSEAFTGLVVVALAGNAVENVVGIELAVKNKADLAISIILNSCLQVALALTPMLVILSFFLSPTPLTLVLPPLLVAALALAAILGALIVDDGESNWLEGIALIGLYGMIAISFWWG